MDFNVQHFDDYTICDILLYQLDINPNVDFKFSFQNRKNFFIITLVRSSFPRY